MSMLSSWNDGPAKQPIEGFVERVTTPGSPEVITKHYHGDDTDVKLVAGGVLKAFEGVTVDDYETAATEFLERSPHPTLERRLRDCTYAPMTELLKYLEAHTFVNYIASGGDRDFIPMLQFAGGKGRPVLRLRMLHDDRTREFDYVSGTAASLELARSRAWTVISMKEDWNAVFAPVGH